MECPDSVDTGLERSPVNCDGWRVLATRLSTADRHKLRATIRDSLEQVADRAAWLAQSVARPQVHPQPAGRVKYDIAFPQLTRALARSETALERLDPSEVADPGTPLEVPDVVPDEYIKYRGMHLIDKGVIEPYEFQVPYAEDPSGVITYYTKSVAKAGGVERVAGASRRSSDGPGLPPRVSFSTALSISATRSCAWLRTMPSRWWWAPSSR